MWTWYEWTTTADLPMSAAVSPEGEGYKNAFFSMIWVQFHKNELQKGGRKIQILISWLLFCNTTYHFYKTWRQSHESFFSDLGEYPFSGQEFMIFCNLLRLRFIWMYSYLRKTCSNSYFYILKSKLFEIIICFDFYDRLRDMKISIGTPVKHHWKDIKSLHEA